MLALALQWRDNHRYVMSETGAQTTPETIDEATFMALFLNAPSGSAFRLMDGVLDAPDEPIVQVSTYVGDARDLIQVMGEKHKQHGLASFTTDEAPIPQASVKIVYPKDGRWSFDVEHPDYRLKRIEIETESGERVNASLLKTTNGFTLIDCWLVRDGR